MLRRVLKLITLLNEHLQVAEELGAAFAAGAGCSLCDWHGKQPLEHTRNLSGVTILRNDLAVRREDLISAQSGTEVKRIGHLRRVDGVTRY